MSQFLQQPPTDTVSDISFSPTADMLSVASWDSQTRIYNVHQDGSSSGIEMISNQKPVLATCWSNDGQRVYSGGVSGECLMMDMNSRQQIQVASHNEPISCISIVGSDQGQASNLLVTCSWDKLAKVHLSNKFWDSRTPNPVHVLNLPDRIYSMDICKNLLVIACANRHISCFNLQTPTASPTTTYSPLKFQTRVVAAFPDGTGYCVGGIDGRIGVEYQGNSSKGYSFKCHRSDKRVNMVNDLCFTRLGTVASVGSDGGISIWDTNAKSLIHKFDNEKMPVLKCAFNRDSKLFAYACGLDWQDNRQQDRYDGYVKITRVEPSNIKPKNLR